MKLITRDTDYAVRALCFMAKHKQGPVSVDTLVDALELPRAFLRKILQLLNKKKVLKSFKGKAGGFSLNMPAENIYLYHIIEIFQGSLQLNKCIFKRRVCPNVRDCILKKKLDSIERYVSSKISKITIASLV
jgi:Rrf2 family protein